MKPITFQIQVESQMTHTERELLIMLEAMNNFADAMSSMGYVRSQMYIGEDSYNGEPLEVKQDGPR